MLRVMLADGDLAAKDVYANAKAQGISPATLERAKKGLAASYRNEEVAGSPWYLRLEGDTPVFDAAQVAAEIRARKGLT